VLFESGSEIEEKTNGRLGSVSAIAVSELQLRAIRKNPINPPTNRSINHNTAPCAASESEAYNIN